MPERVAYRGPAFTIEWYFAAGEKSQALEFFDALTEDRQDDVLMLFRRMAETGKIFDKTKFRNEGDQIFAFKPQPDRFLCFFWTGRKILVTNAFQKKSQKLPKGEKERALKAMKDYENRIEKGTYYEKD